MAATQDGDGGTAYLNLHVVGSSSSSVVFGSLIYHFGDVWGYRMVAGSITSSGWILNIGQPAPVMLLGANT